MLAHSSVFGPENVIDCGDVKKPGLEPVACAMVKLAVRDAPLPRSTMRSSAVWFAALAVTRTRARARPISSVTVVVVKSVDSVAPGCEVMKRKSPETTSKRTPRPMRGWPPCESCTETSASPPEQIAGAHVPPCVDDGVMVTSLPTVPGRTVRVEVATGVVPVSRTVMVTSVSAVTPLGITVKVLVGRLPASGITAWLLELTM